MDAQLAGSAAHLAGTHQDHPTREAAAPFQGHPSYGPFAMRFWAIDKPGTAVHQVAVIAQLILKTPPPS